MIYTLPHEKEIKEHQKTIEHLLKQSGDNPLSKQEIKKLEKKIASLKNTVYSTLTPWQRVQICRHPDRPHGIHYINNICTDFQELFGDRTFRDDPSLIGGLARIDGMKCVVIAQEKGSNTDERLHRNFAMMHPEGYRKALRLMQLAEKFHLPVVSLIDTPGAYCCLEAEERGVAWAIAMNLREMMQLKTPILVVIIGEGCSGGAIGIGVGDSIAMLEHAYYSVITPEACASIIWKDSSKHVQAASALKLNSENLLEYQVIDEIIGEPQGGAHYNPNVVYQGVKQFLVEKGEILHRLPIPLLLEQRYAKYRRIGPTQNETTS